MVAFNPSNIFNLLDEGELRVGDADIRVLNKIGFDILKFLKQYLDAVTYYKVVVENPSADLTKLNCLRNSAILSLLKVKVRIMDSCTLYKKIIGLDKNSSITEVFESIYNNGISIELFDANFISDLNYCCDLFNSDDCIRFGEVIDIMQDVLLDITKYGSNLLKYKI